MSGIFVGQIVGIPRELLEQPGDHDLSHAAVIGPCEIKIVQLMRHGIAHHFPGARFINGAFGRYGQAHAAHAEQRELQILKRAVDHRESSFLYESGAKEVHIRVGCPPLLFNCKYLNFSRSSSEMDLITRRVITELEGKEPDRETLLEYAKPDSEKYKNMLDAICKQLHFTSLRYHRLDDVIESIGLPEDKLCTYCWSGKE